MGVHGMISNNKRVRAAHRRQKRAKLMKAKRGKAALKSLPKTGDILDPELVSAGVLKKRQTSTRTNITLSGKKKRKIMKQLKRLNKEKDQMDAAEVNIIPEEPSTVEMSGPSGSSKKSKKKKRGKKTTAQKDSNDIAELSDVVMECDNK